MKGKLSKLLLCLSCFLLFKSANAQDGDLSVAYAYPFTVGDHFVSNTFSDGYEGIISLLIHYNFNRDDVMHGFQFRPTYLNDQILLSDEVRTNLYNFNAMYTVSTEIGGEGAKIVPGLGLGLNSFHFRTDEFRYVTPTGKKIRFDKYKDNKIGMALNASIKFVFEPHVRAKYYVLVDYEFTRLVGEGIPNGAFNRNVQIMNIGFGSYIPLL